MTVGKDIPNYLGLLREGNTTGCGIKRIFQFFSFPFFLPQNQAVLKPVFDSKHNRTSLQIFFSQLT